MKTIDFDILYKCCYEEWECLYLDILSKKYHFKLNFGNEKIKFPERRKAFIDYSLLVILKELNIMDIFCRKFHKIYFMEDLFFVLEKEKERMRKYKADNFYKKLIDKDKIRSVVFDLGIYSDCELYKEFLLITNNKKFLNKIDIKKISMNKFITELYANAFINEYKWNRLIEYTKDIKFENEKMLFGNNELEKYKLLFDFEILDWLREFELFDNIFRTWKCIFLEENDFEKLKEKIEFYDLIFLCNKKIEELKEYIITKKYHLDGVSVFEKYNITKNNYIYLNIDNLIDILNVMKKEFYLNEEEYRYILRKLKDMEN